MTREGRMAYDDAIKFLEKQRPLKPFKWNDAIAQAAIDHCSDEQSDLTVKLNKYGESD